MSDTAAFEAALTDFFLGPDEGLSLFVVCVDVGIDMLLELLKACEGSAVERLPVCTENLNTGVVVMKSAQDGV